MLGLFFFLVVGERNIGAGFEELLPELFVVRAQKFQYYPTLPTYPAN
jgi:hypothetical protein